MGTEPSYTVPTRVDRSVPPPDAWGRGVVPERWGAVERHLRPGERVLDLGAGHGAYVVRLREAGFDPVGFDLHEYDSWRRTGTGRYVAGRAEALPFATDAFDATIAFEVLEHVPEPQAMLREIARCTRRVAILSVPNCAPVPSLQEHSLAPAHWVDRTHCNFFTKESLRALLEAEGYRVLDIADAFRIDANRHYWSRVKLPRPLTRRLERLFDRFGLVEPYWSSILLAAEVPGGA